MQIRPATGSDVSEVARVWREGWLEAHVGHVPEALMAERTESYFTQTAEDLVESTLVAVDDDALVGVVLIHEDELFQIAVTPQARRRGVGRALVRAAEEHIGTAHDRAELAVVSANTAAREFYARCGWTDLGEIVQPARAANLEDEPVPVRAHLFAKDLH